MILRLLVVLLLTVSCNQTQSKVWRATQCGEIIGFQVPECVLPVSDGKVFVSNIEAEEGAYWDNDKKGFISLMDSDGKDLKLRWFDSNKDMVIHSPKGMCLIKGFLYFTDNDRLHRVPEKGGVLETIPIPGGIKLNDLATDGEFVYVSDTTTGRITRVSLKGELFHLKGPEGVNGVTCFEGRIYAVSWTLHDLYEIDPKGAKQARAFQLAQHFTNLDGIECLPDGTFVVSDFMGDKVCLVSADEKEVKTLFTVKSPADIGMDVSKMLLYAPLFMEDKVRIYKLEH